LIPLRLYFSDRGYAKVELGLGKGKKQEDRREELRRRAMLMDERREGLRK
jgi:SsrA-binding protein